MFPFLFWSFSSTTQSVGLLSYTFLRATGHEDIVVPMVTILSLVISGCYIWVGNLEEKIDFGCFEM